MNDGQTKFALKDHTVVTDKDSKGKYHWIVLMHIAHTGKPIMKCCNVYTGKGTCPGFPSKQSALREGCKQPRKLEAATGRK